jgi:uncharacterized pyridoxal phosphate-containing UPF0001 family protein
LTDADRRAQLASALHDVRGRIARACSAAGRDPASVTLVAVTKTYPASDVLLLAELGVTDVGENKDQEAGPKAACVRAAGARLRWHYVGQLQRNKAKSVVRYADVVESVDSLRLVAALDRAAASHRSSPLDVLVQVSLDGDPSRGGAVLSSAVPSSFVPSFSGAASSGAASSGAASSGAASSGVALDRDLWRVADAVASSEALRLRGVMTVAPVGWEPDHAFASLAALAERMRARYPDATVVSAGMSGDLEDAVRHGATHVRIGTSLLGMRNTLR